MHAYCEGRHFAKSVCALFTWMHFAWRTAPSNVFCITCDLRHESRGRVKYRCVRKESAISGEENKFAVEETISVSPYTHQHACAIVKADRQVAQRVDSSLDTTFKFNRHTWAFIHLHSQTFNFHQFPFFSSPTFALLLSSPPPPPPPPAPAQRRERVTVSRRSSITLSKSHW